MPEVKTARCGWCLTKRHGQCVKDSKEWHCSCDCWKKGRRTLSYPKETK